MKKTGMKMRSFKMRSRIRVLAALMTVLMILLPSSCKKGIVTPEQLPVIWVNMSTMNLSAAALGVNPNGHSISIKNSGFETLNYIISDDANFYNNDWLTITPASGTSSGEEQRHTVFINKDGLDPREEPYVAKIKVESSEAYNSPQYVDVALTITDQIPAIIVLSTKEIEFSGRPGGPNPSPKAFTVRNDGELDLDYSLESDASWFSVTPSSGSIGNNGINTHTIAANINDMNNGVYESLISVVGENASNSPQFIQVKLALTDAPPPVIGVQPDALTFTATTGSNPVAQKIQIFNAGDGLLKYQLSWNTNWLNVSPLSGQSNGTLKNHTVSINVQGLKEGNYSENLIVSDPAASNNPVSIPISLQISDAPPPPPPPPPSTDNEINIGLVPSAGPLNTVVTVKIGINGNLSKISAFGLNVTFDPSMYSYVGFSNGTLTSSWGGVAASSVGGGVIIVGGYGGVNSIPVSSVGTLIEIRLRVNGSSANRSICIGAFTDDIVGLTPAPGCAPFTLQ